MSDRKKPNNLRTALILLAVVLVFFSSMFVRRLWLN